MPVRETIVRGMGAVAGCLALAMSAGGARAELPGILDRVPEGADAVVLIPNLNALLDDVSAFTRAFGQAMPAETRQQITGSLLVARGVLNGGGVNASGAAALVLEFPEDAAEDATPEELFMAAEKALILPIDDVEAFSEQDLVAGLGATMQNGTLSWAMNGGEAFIRGVGGGYAVLSDAAAVVEAYENRRGFIAGHAEMLGQTGDRLTAANDVTLVANVAAFREIIEAAMATLGQQARMGAALAGGGAEGADAFIELAELVTGNFARDGEAGMLGLNIGSEGFAFDLGASFREGSELGELFTGEGDSSGLLTKIPEMSYIVAMAVDISNTAARQVVTAMNDLNAGEGNPLGQAFAFNNDMLEDAERYAYVLGPSPVMGGGGLFANALMYVKSEKPETVAGALKDMMRAMDGTAAEGFAYTTTVDENVQANGLELDTYSMTMAFDPDTAPPGLGPEAMMGINMILGPQGRLSGYLAEGNGGLYTTYSRNAELVRRALNAGQDGVSFATFDKVPAASEQMLDHGRFIEAYLSLNGLADAALPLLMMMGAGAQLPEIPQMEPIGFSGSVGERGVTFRGFVPASVISFGIELGETMGAGAAPAGGDPDRPRF